MTQDNEWKYHAFPSLMNKFVEWYENYSVDIGLPTFIDREKLVNEMNFVLEHYFQVAETHAELVMITLDRLGIGETLFDKYLEDTIV